jgi:hypothetical protein
MRCPGYFSRFGCSISSRSPPLSIAATMSSKHILLLASDLSSRFFSGLHVTAGIAALYGQSKACQLCHSPRDDVAPTTSTRRPAGRLPAPSVRRRGAPTGARETSLRLPPTVTRKTNNFLRRLRICSIFVLNAARPERDRRVVRVRRRPSAQRRPSDRSGRAAHAAEAGRSQASRRSLERGVSVGETVAREGETRRPEMALQALVCLFAAVRRRSAARILCW